jgi:hypothetical protein
LREIRAVVVPTDQIVAVRIPRLQPVDDEIHAVRVDHRDEIDADAIPHIRRGKAGQRPPQRTGLRVILRELHQHRRRDPLQRMVGGVVQHGITPRTEAQVKKPFAQHAFSDAACLNKRVARFQARDVALQHRVRIADIRVHHVEIIRYDDTLPR